MPDSSSSARSRAPWGVLAVAVVTATLTGPGQTIGVSVFIDHFVDDLGLGRSSVSGAYLVGTLTGSLALPFVGRFVDRRGVRIAQVLVGAAFTLALVNMSFVNGLVWLTIGFVGIRCLGQGSLSLISTVTVSVAFTERRGFALGIFSVVSAGLMALVPFGLNAAIDRVGWEQAWLIAAAVVGSIVVPIGWFGLRSLPRGVERSPARARPVSTGAPIGPGIPAATEDRHDPSLTRGEAVRTRIFWVITLSSSTASMLVTALNFHQIDLLGDAGLSEAAAAAMFIPQVVGSTVAGLAVGWAADRIGTRFLPAVAMVLMASAHVLAAIAGPGWSVLVYAVSLGATGGAVRVVTSTLLPVYFGTTHLGSIQGVLNLVGVGASALGPVTLAVAEGWLGSYPPAALALAVLPVATAVFALGRVEPPLGAAEVS